MTLVEVTPGALLLLLDEPHPAMTAASAQTAPAASALWLFRLILYLLLVIDCLIKTFVKGLPFPPMATQLSLDYDSRDRRGVRRRAAIARTAPWIPSGHASIAAISTKP